MPQYVKDSNEFEYFELVLRDGRIYGVLEDDQEETASLVTPEDIVAHNGNYDDLINLVKKVPICQIQLPDPVEPDPQTLKAFFRLEVTPWELLKQGQFPFSTAAGNFVLSEDDLLCLINRLPLIENEFIWRNWRWSFLDSDEFGKPKHVTLPEVDRPGFSLRFFTDKLFETLDWMDPIEKDWEYAFKLRDCYLKSKNKPLSKTVLPSKYFLRDMAQSLIEYAQTHSVTDEIRDYYSQILDQCLALGTVDDIEEYAYAYYGGNELVPCDWGKSEQALLRLFDPDKNPADGIGTAANSLGYIYASKRLGEPDYAKAMVCFEYAAKYGYIEATYKLSDGYRLGWAGEKDPEKAWDILNKLYKRTNKQDIAHGKYADICLRMGYCYRDGISVETDREKALEFFQKAKRGIEARQKKCPGYGDDVVARNIQAAIKSVTTD